MIVDLGHRVVAADGGRLKLEHAALRSRSGEQVEDLLWCQGDQLLGFCGSYAFSGDIEVAEMADPDTRRRGIDTHLVIVALELCAERGHGRVLLDVVRTRAGGEVLPRRPRPRSRRQSRTVMARTLAVPRWSSTASTPAQRPP